jgi:hypothetical protein
MNAKGVDPMYTLLNALACAALLAVLALHAAPAAATADAPPWLIANGQPGAGLYMPRDVKQAYAKGTRSLDGRPGPSYWQNHAEHRIRITVSPPSRRVQGEQEIVYTNHSPDPLSMLVFRLYLNAHHPQALRESAVDAKFLTQGLSVEDFSIDGKTVPWNNPADPLAGNNTPGSTIHALTLAKPLPPKGSVRLRMRWAESSTTTSPTSRSRWTRRATSSSGPPARCKTRPRCCSPRFIASCRPASRAMRSSPWRRRPT